MLRCFAHFVQELEADRAAGGAGKLGAGVCDPAFNAELPLTDRTDQQPSRDAAHPLPQFAPLSRIPANHKVDNRVHALISRVREVSQGTYVGPPAFFRERP